jgi:predicted DNA binding protein
MGNWTGFLQGFLQKKRLFLRSKKEKKPKEEDLELYYFKKMNELLDKINKLGYKSLTKKERRILKEASEYMEKKDKN